MPENPECPGECDPCEPTCLYLLRRTEGRCERCGNWPNLCGHDLPFKERMKSVAIDRSSLRA
jgi:hypothetical protein